MSEKVKVRFLANFCHEGEDVGPDYKKTAEVSEADARYFEATNRAERVAVKTQKAAEANNET